MAAKQNELIIKDWQTGIASNGLFGFADMRNVEISLTQGIVWPTYASTKKTGTTVTGKPIWAVQDNDSNATIYVQDDANVIYKAAFPWTSWSVVTHASASTGHGNGLAIFKGYLFSLADSTIDVYGPLNSSPAWTNAWHNILSDTLTHPALTGQDDILYIGNGVDDSNRLGATLISIKQNSGQIFAPGTPATYAINDTAVQLPYPYRIRCLAELGQNLMIGTFIGNDLNSNYTKRIGDIFPWNRSSSTFNLPIRLFEQGINSILNIGNVLYISAGQTGNLYLYNGYQASVLFKFPRSTSSAYSSPYLPLKFYPQSLMFIKNRLFFSVSGAGTGSNGTSGVYSVSLDGQGLVMENSISTGNTDNNVDIPCLLPLSDNLFKYLLGWKDTTNTAQGIDIVGQDSFNTSNNSLIDSAIYNNGTVLVPTTLTRGEIYLDTPLVSGDSLILQYRTSRTGSWTTLETFSFANNGAVQQIYFDIHIEDNQIQFRLTWSGANASPRLKYVRFI